MKPLLLLLALLTLASCATISNKKARAYIETQPAEPLLGVRDGDGSNLPVKGRKQGDVFIKNDTIYQVYGIETDTLYGAAYIYLDGKKLTKPEIDSRRTEILQKYKSGTPLADLISAYNMDGNPKAYDFRFVLGQAANEFEDELILHKPGEVFTIDVAQYDWYYVVLRKPDNIHIYYYLKSCPAPEKGSY